jgi:hypothetical protein
MWTPTTLNFENNEIGHEGAQYLADTFRQNSVRLIFYLSVSYVCISFNTDTYYSES